MKSFTDERCTKTFFTNLSIFHSFLFTDFPPVMYTIRFECAKYLASNENNVRVYIEEWNQQTT